MNDRNEPATTATLADERRTAPQDGPDPLASLHKMSTTAGVSAQEYVAINNPSIIACMLGPASLVAVLNPVLLVVPLAAIITAVASLRQIRESNGTQSGRGFAWLGIVLALGIGGFVLARAVAKQVQNRADRQAIVGKIEELGRLVHARQYEQAYALFSPRFQNRINRATFDANWETSQKYPELGPIAGMEWNRTDIDFKDDPDSGARVGYAAAWVRFEKAAEPARYYYEFRKSGPNWLIEDAPTIFPPERAARRRR
jgi:hypothetical protein